MPKTPINPSKRRYPTEDEDEIPIPCGDDPTVEPYKQPEDEEDPYPLPKAMEKSKDGVTWTKKKARGARVNVRNPPHRSRRCDRK